MTCQRLREGGVRCVDLPKGPGRVPAKPKLAEFMKTWAGAAEIEVPESDASSDDEE
jgi:hypothetical protein